VLFAFVTACDKSIVEDSFSDEATLKSASHQLANFRAHLDGSNEVPANVSKATGEAVFKLSKDGTMLHYKLIVANIEDVRMSHIHLAPAGTNGGVVVWLYPAGPPPVLLAGTSNGVIAEGVIKTENLVGALAGKQLSDLVDAIKVGNAYVNVHTLMYPGGEIRGQIMGN